MYKEIEIELNVLEKNLFTGHVKFGVEHGSITSMSMTSKIEPTISGIVSNWKNEIQKLYSDEKDFFGAVDFSFNFGKITSSNYSVSLHGEQLNERLRTNQCRSVKVVVKKSDL